MLNLNLKHRAALFTRSDIFAWLGLVVITEPEPVVAKTPKTKRLVACRGNTNPDAEVHLSLVKYSTRKAGENAKPRDRLSFFSRIPQTSLY